MDRRDLANLVLLVVSLRLKVDLPRLVLLVTTIIIDNTPQAAPRHLTSTPTYTIKDHNDQLPL
jgi:hypothetical protein